MNANQKKSHQLGMPHGTAAAKLRKAIMFELIQQAQRDSCFKCSKTIESSDDMTIEHKEPWLDNDPALFWSLENIAFSHKACNRPHRTGPRKRPRFNEAGEVWCKGCKRHLPLTDFSMYTGKTRNNFGPRSHCKRCRSNRRKEGETI